jgi:predicted TIM-barrel fold metal-dependent hydrolase
VPDDAQRFFVRAAPASSSITSAYSSPFTRRSRRSHGQSYRRCLALAQYPNVNIKISGACTLSQQPFPYNDIWGPVLKIIDAFGIDRCMWGTDWTRATELLTYEQGVAPFRATDHLSDTDKAKLMGGTLEEVYRWAPATA